MANVTINVLPDIGTPDISALLAAYQSGTTYSVSLLEIQTLFDITASSSLSLAGLNLSDQRRICLWGLVI